MEIAYLDGKKEPYTTSEIIAECAEVQHHTIQELIRKHKGDFESYGIIAFEMRKLDGRGRPMKIYRLNEQQATLLVTYLKNTEPVRTFKKSLVKAFFDLRHEVATFQIQRALEKPKRKELTDAIQRWQHVNKWSYKALTDLLLKQVTGKNAKQLKQDASCSGLDLLTAQQLERYQALEQLVISLVELNYTYDEIKGVMMKNLRKPQNLDGSKLS